MDNKKKCKFPAGFNSNLYIDGLVSYIRPVIKQKLSKKPAVYVNTRVMDTELCEDLTNDTNLADGKRRWVDLNRNTRLRILTKTLIDKFGYKIWSGKSRKVLCKPANAFKRASELEKKYE